MAQIRLLKTLRTASVVLLLAFLALSDGAYGERWAEAAPPTEEVSLNRDLIRAIRAESWLKAVELADRYRGSPASTLSQSQAFAYAMNGRLDLVSEFQRDGRIPAAEVCDETPGLESQDAVEAILEAAARHRAVIIQEFHWDVQHRFILHALLPRLRELGYTHFAAEDFEGAPDAYETVTYPREAAGFHSTREPVFADAVRTAIRLGYRLVPYEASLSPNLQPQDIRRERVEQQAGNLYRRIFSNDPEAKAIVFAGFGFAREAPHPDFPADVPMLVRFKQFSGIDPLTIDQTICRQQESGAYQVATVSLHENGEAAIQGVPADTFDLQILYAPASYERLGRADWLTRLERRPVAIPHSLRHAQEAVVIEAHVVGEPPDAAPIDRIYLGADEELPLLLPPGEFRITVHGSDELAVIVAVE